MTAKDVELREVSKRFGEVEAVRPLSLRVEPGEFLTLLGPSGCGKTTLLRMIAGIESVTAGAILVGGVDVTALPPHRRDTSIMFQDYALFPHKSLIENVAYGLKMRRVARATREAQARDWLRRIGLAEMSGRLPHQLSGGQRQRVALARALIINPGVLLLDEPLGALDANLRRQLQGELKRLHREVGLTFIYVTHDQEEAIRMSDRIAVLRAGAIEQLGVPKAIYDRPETEFVARFIGHCNVVRATVAEGAGPAILCDAGAFGRLRPGAELCLSNGQSVSFALRPEAVELRPAAEPLPDANGARLKVTEVDFTGGGYVVRGEAADGRALEIALGRRDAPARLPSPGEEILATWPAAALTPLRPAERSKDDAV